MSKLGRVAIACVTALLIGAFSYVDALDIDRTGILGNILHNAALPWAFLALPVLTVALVNRWWGLSIALVPFAVEFFLHSATDYVYPYHDDPYPAGSPDIRHPQARYEAHVATTRRTGSYPAHAGSRLSESKWSGIHLDWPPLG